jgi:hypothetical protein
MPCWTLTVDASANAGSGPDQLLVRGPLPLHQVRHMSRNAFSALEAGTIVTLEDRQHKLRDRMPVQIRRYVAQLQAAFRIRPVGVRLNFRCQGRGVESIPAAGFGIQNLRRRLG